VATLESDAYATGEALVALAESGALAVTAPACAAASTSSCVLSTPTAHGSSAAGRCPLQPHFKSGFPYGRDQFISAAATTSAARALIAAARPRS
jgi:hypothetical protein